MSDTSLWPVHKVLCKAPQWYFQQAPLNEAELGLLFQIKSMPMPPMNGASFMQTVGRHDSEWPLIVAVVGSPVFALPYRPEDRMFSSIREQTIMLARLGIKALCELSADGLPPNMGSTAAWHELASYLAPAGKAYYTANPRVHTAVTDEDPKFETVLNGYFRAVLALCVVTRHAISTSDRTKAVTESEWYPLLQLHHERVEKELAAADVQESVKETLRQLNRGRWYIEPRTPGSAPALHP